MQCILVVEDDRAQRAALVPELRSLPDVEIQEASGGGEALRALGSRPFDLIVLDLHMPLIDGFTVLRTLNSKPGPNERTPVYVVTGDLSEQARARAMSLGAVFFMAKPISAPTLLAVVAGSLKKAARDAEAERKAREDGKKTRA